MILKTKFKDLVLFQNISFKDNRGYFKEILLEKNLKKKFPFTVMSFSKKNVVRGLHIQRKKPQGKFVTVLKGKIFDVALDLRKNSKTFGKHFAIILSEKNSKSIFIPPGFTHGFCALDKENIPTQIEITFAKNPKKISNLVNFPHELDQPSNPNFQDIELLFENN